jgi:hypothetical protein
MSFRSWLRYLFVKGIRLAMDAGISKTEYLAGMESIDALARADPS